MQVVSFLLLSRRVVLMCAFSHILAPLMLCSFEPSHLMNGENLLVVIDEPVEFEEKTYDTCH